MSYRISFFAILTLLLFILSAGCVQTGEQNADADQEPDTEPQFEQAVAVIHPTEGNDVEGTVTFTQTEDGVRVQANVTGLEGESLHGFHIHQYGDCSASDGTSAGGHYSPRDMPHGAPTADQRHVGDMGNLPVDASGLAEMEYTDMVIELNGPNSIIGRGVIVHAGRDDFQSQPTGDAGARLGCGVIGVANPEN